jgi:hypothetical protein
MRSTLQHLINRRPILVVDESETPVTTRLLVHHERRVADLTVLTPERPERFLSARLGEGADEKLVGFGGVGTGDGAFRVDLRVTKKEGASDGGAQRTGGREETYGLAVEVVLPGHNGVDGVGLREGKEGETTGTSRLLIAHDGAVGDSTELLEVGLERLCKGRKTRSELFVVSLLSQATKETDRRLCPSSGHR